MHHTAVSVSLITVCNCKIHAEVLAFLQKWCYKQSPKTHRTATSWGLCVYVQTLEGVVLTYFQKLHESLTGSTGEESHKAAALLQWEVRATQEPLSIQQCQFKRKPLKSTEHYHSFLVKAVEARFSGPCQSQGSDLTRHIRKASLFFAVSSRKAGRSEIRGTPLRGSSVG